MTRVTALYVCVSGKAVLPQDLPTWRNISALDENGEGWAAGLESVRSFRE
jgi:hypothetical protein